jgi:predicted ATPase
VNEEGLPLSQSVVDAFVRTVVLKRDETLDFDVYPFSIPAIRQLHELSLDPRVTLFAGENGSGKSTLVEAIAVAAGFNAEGGSRNMTVSTRASHSVLHRHLRLVRGTHRPRTGYFLRAESFFNVATYVEELHHPGAAAAHGGISLHERSHGESFIALFSNRFGPKGLYILDEPEAALSLRGNLALMRRMHDLVAADSSSSPPTRRSCSAIRVRRFTSSPSTGSPRRRTKRQTSSSPRGHFSTTASSSCITCSRTSDATRQLLAATAALSQRVMLAPSMSAAVRTFSRRLVLPPPSSFFFGSTSTLGGAKKLMAT